MEVVTAEQYNFDEPANIDYYRARVVNDLQDRLVRIRAKGIFGMAVYDIVRRATEYARQDVEWRDLGVAEIDGAYAIMQVMAGTNEYTNILKAVLSTVRDLLLSKNVPSLQGHMPEVNRLLAQMKQYAQT